MSIYHLTNENSTSQQTLYVTTCYVSGGINISQKLETKELVFQAQNNDLIELSTLADKGLNNQVLKSNGDGTVSWEDNPGITFNGTLPSTNNQLTVFSGVDGTTVKNSSLVEQDIIDIQTKANNNESDISNLQNDKLNRDGTQLMTGNLQMANNSITGVNNLTAINVYSNVNTLSISGLLGQDVSINNNMNFLSSNNIKNLNNLQTQEIKATDGTSINIQDDINMNLYDINNCTELRTNVISTNTTGNVLIGNNLNMNNNNINNISTIVAQTIQAKDAVSVNFDNNIEMQGNEIKSTKAIDFFFNSDSANIGVGAGNLEIAANNCGLNAYSGFNKYASFSMNQGNNGILLNYNTNSADFNALDINLQNNNLYNCNEVKTDFLASSTNTQVKMNNDLNLNGNNIIGLELINGIQPSGGLYSESSGFSTASLTEINILGQGSSSGSLSIPANGFTALSTYSFKASGVLTGGTNDLFTLRAKSITDVPSTITLGTIMVTLQDNGLINVPWDIMIDFSIRNIGIANTAQLVLSGCFRYSNNNDVVKSFLRTVVLTTGFDTTVSNSLQLTFQNDGTDPLTSFRIDQSSFTKWY